MNWDWYSATIKQWPDEVLPVLVGGFDLASLQPCRGVHSYARGAEVRRGDRVFCRAYWGGVNGQESVHVQSSGADAPGVVDLLRRNFPEHRVSRADAREDYIAPGAWELLTAAALAVADEHGVKVEHAGDHHRAQDGRSLYFGGREALARVIVYEKGKQLGLDPHWVRLEVRVRPKGAGKSVLASAQPAQLMGASTWTKSLAARIGAPEIGRLQVRDPFQPSDEDRAIQWMLKQYGEAIEGLAVKLGSYAALGNYLGEQIRSMRREKH